MSKGLHIVVVVMQYVGYIFDDSSEYVNFVSPSHSLCVYCVLFSHFFQLFFCNSTSWVTYCPFFWTFKILTFHCLVKELILQSWWLAWHEGHCMCNFDHSFLLNSTCPNVEFLFSTNLKCPPSFYYNFFGSLNYGS